jgi:hypothetical protein
MPYDFPNTFGPRMGERGIKETLTVLIIEKVANMAW